jgi:hypothetical protein
MVASARSNIPESLPSDIGFGENFNSALAANSKSKLATNRTLISALASMEKPLQKPAEIE